MITIFIFYQTFKLPLVVTNSINWGIKYEENFANNDSVDFNPKWIWSCCTE